MNNTKDILPRWYKGEKIKELLFPSGLYYVGEMLSLSHIYYSSKAFIISCLPNCFEVIQ